MPTKKFNASTQHDSTADLATLETKVAVDSSADAASGTDHRPASRGSLVLAPTARFDGALFNIAEKRPDGPVMSGLVTLEGQRVGLSAFLKSPDGKKQYLSLSMGEEGSVHYYGKLFRVDGKFNDTSPDYSGYMKTLPCDGETDYSGEQWDAAPQVQVFGWKRRSADGTARIALSASPRTVDDAELPL